MTDVAAQFSELFAGRTDAYGLDKGGCARVDDERGWRSLWRDHLNGVEPIGVYPLTLNADRLNLRSDIDIDVEWECKWGCVDLDIKTDSKPSGDYECEEDAHVAAVNLQRVLTHFGVTSWIERTRSGGRHIWVFAQSWLPASVMRRSLLVASNVARTSTREINPKQTELTNGQVGSYVRLPYPGVLKLDAFYLPSRYMISAHGMTLSYGRWAERAVEERTSRTCLEKIAAYYREPEQPKTVPPPATYGSWAPPLERRLNNLAYALYTKGDTSDRSALIEAFVRSSRDSGLGAPETLLLASNLAHRTGKFEGRADRERQLATIVGRAYA